MQTLKLFNYDLELSKNPDAKILDPRTNNMTHVKQANEYIDELFGGIQNDIDIVATCKCGCRKGDFYLGSMCPNCHTEVRHAYCDDLNFKCWIAIPKELPPLMHPIVHQCLERWCGNYKDHKLLDVILDPRLELPELLSGEIEQGLYWVSNNIEYLIDKLIEYFNKIPGRATAIRDADDIKKFINKYATTAFVRHVPILNQNLHPITKEGTNRFSDDSSRYILELYIDICTLHFDITNGIYDEVNTLSIMNSIQHKWIEYTLGKTSSILVGKLSTKKGVMRHDLCGSCLFFTFRGVIKPITSPHIGDEIYLPWAMLVNGKKREILNILINRMHFTPSDALYKHMRALVQYDPEIDKCLEILKEECTYKGFGCIFNRNPTIEHGSMQKLFITRWHKNVNDKSIHMSPRICQPFNADYDGDELNGIFIFENDMMDKFDTIHPYNIIPSKSDTTISSKIGPSGKGIINFNNFMHYGRNNGKGKKFDFS